MTQTYANMGTWTREHPLLHALRGAMDNIKGLARNTNEIFSSLREKSTEDKEDETNVEVQVKWLIISTKTDKFN